MANLIESDSWPDGIYQIEEDDPVLGGPTGITNQPPRDLASRARFQRLRNVTPWLATLDYPANVSYVSHAGTTWKSVAANINVMPGTDATKWVRWGHTATELFAQIDGGISSHEGKEDPHPRYVKVDGDEMAGPLALAANSTAVTPALDAPGMVVVTAAFVNAMVGRRTVARFIAPGVSNWVVPANVYRVLRKVWGAGGGGGGSLAVGSPFYAGSGGGGGGYAEGWLDVTPGQTLALVVGAGGAGGTGAASLTTGDLGGVSSCAGISATGGPPGTGQTPGTTSETAGGSASGAGLQVGRDGGRGGIVLSNSAGSGWAIGGSGGSAPFGGQGGVQSTSGAGAGVAPGGGGGGSGCSGVSMNGGQGANGEVQIWY